MYLKQKRRIFSSAARQNRRSPPWRGLAVFSVAACLISVGAVAGVTGAYYFGGDPPGILRPLFALLQGTLSRQSGGADAGALAAPAAKVAVVDGETLRLDDKVVHLVGVSAPNRGQQCRAQNGSRFDCGAASAEALAEMVKNRPVECEILGQDRHHRPLAVCETQEAVLNRAVILAGWARAESAPAAAKTLALPAEEAKARAARRGLWGGATRRNSDPSARTCRWGLLFYAASAKIASITSSVE